MNGIQHWSVFGRRGEPAATRVSATDWKTKPFQKSETAKWNQTIPSQDLPNLLNGFKPQQMEDKWFVYAEGPDAYGVATLHFHRSWTGYKKAEVKLIVQIAEDGAIAEKDARIIEITWETDKGRVGVATEEDAKWTVAKVCDWCLGTSCLVEALNPEKQE